MLWRLILR